jgi:osmoprotectant transport system permease protein
MPDDNKPKRDQLAQEPVPLSQRIPYALITWVIVAIILFWVGQNVVTMQDQERFPGDFELVLEETEAENTVNLLLVAGTFEYNVDTAVSTPVETGTFTDGGESYVASQLFASVDFLTEVRIEPQTITVVYEGDMEAEQVISRLRRPVNNAVVTDRDTITSAVGEEANTIVFTTTAEQFEYGQYTPTLVPQREEYATHEAAEKGSPLAQFITQRINVVQGLVIEPERVIVTYGEGTAVNPMIERVTNALNDFHPRASLRPNLWLLTLGLSPERIIDVGPFDTGLPLVLYALLFAIIEGALFYFWHNREEKLLRPLIRVVGIFFLFWSIFGHEPLWDFILHWMFPTSRQLIHPNATVIEFTAQHLELVFVSSLITIPAGLFFGILVTREEFRQLLPLVNNLVNSGQTVPTIAIVAIMAPIIGFGFWPAIIALVAYGLLPVVRNTIAGIEAVSDFIIDSARGMGMTPGQILFQIELPIASSIIMAGIRTSMVINIGTATLGAFVGSGGLGTPIASGLSMTVDAFILLGAIPAALLAILVDYILGRIEYVITPRGLQIET